MCKIGLRLLISLKKYLFFSMLEKVFIFKGINSVNFIEFKKLV